MTNAQIIFNESVKLMNQGILSTTGRSFTYETEDGQKITVNEPEPIHTYAAWIEKGYQVRKGEKSIASIAIWKQGKPYTVKNADGTETQKDGKMFLKTAYFFKASQVDKIEKKGEKTA